jgi:hypothetical protein
MAGPIALAFSGVAFAHNRVALLFGSMLGTAIVLAQLGLALMFHFASASEPGQQQFISGAGGYVLFFVFVYVATLLIHWIFVFHTIRKKPDSLISAQEKPTEKHPRIVSPW